MLIVSFFVMVYISRGGGGGDGDWYREVEPGDDWYSEYIVGLGGKLVLRGSSYYDTGVKLLGLKGSSSALTCILRLGLGPKREMG